MIEFDLAVFWCPNTGKLLSWIWLFLGAKAQQSD